MTDNIYLVQNDVENTVQYWTLVLYYFEREIKCSEGHRKILQQFESADT